MFILFESVSLTSLSASFISISSYASLKSVFNFCPSFTSFPANSFPFWPFSSLLSSSSSLDLSNLSLRITTLSSSILLSSSLDLFSFKLPRALLRVRAFLLSFICVISTSSTFVFLLLLSLLACANPTLKGGQSSALCPPFLQHQHLLLWFALSLLLLPSLSLVASPASLSSLTVITTFAKKALICASASSSSLSLSFLLGQFLEIWSLLPQIQHALPPPLLFLLSLSSFLGGLPCNSQQLTLACPAFPQ